MTRLMVGLATAVIVYGGLGLAGLGAGTAYADPGFIEPVGPYQWCPGDGPQPSIGITASATRSG